ncbi:Hypothetical predicted protein, partial [Paramuricea clavata]
MLNSTCLVEALETSISPRSNSSTSQKDGTSYLSLIGEKLKAQGLSQSSIKIILASWRAGTHSQYQSQIIKWQEFCAQHKCDMISPPVTFAVDFLAQLSDS